MKFEKGTIPRVSLSLSDWQLIEDMILEITSPKLLKSIKKAREIFTKKKKSFIY